MVQTKKIKAAFFSSNFFGRRLFCFVLISTWMHQQDERERREGGRVRGKVRGERTTKEGRKIDEERERERKTQKQREKHGK